MNNDLSVYLHIPFCTRKCNYCDFYSMVPAEGKLRQYVDAVCSQIRNTLDDGGLIKTIYFGGGTPSLLEKDQFSDLVDSLWDRFDCSCLEEFTVECNPDSVTDEKCVFWQENRVNRVSMGIQSFHDARLKQLGRLHTVREAEDAYDRLRFNGFQNISIDLMIGTTDETLKEAEEDLRRVLHLRPEHLSVYMLKIEEKTVFGKRGVSPADEETTRRIYLAAHRMLTAAGYRHYEISNFALPGYESKHNLNYWRCGEYLAFGPGAAGYRDGIRYRIPEDLNAFIRFNGAVTPVVEERLSEEEKKRERILLGLRLAEGVRMADLPREKANFAGTLAKRGFAWYQGDRFFLTPQGFLVSDYIIEKFLE